MTGETGRDKGKDPKDGQKRERFDEGDRRGEEISINANPSGILELEEFKQAMEEEREQVEDFPEEVEGFHGGPSPSESFLARIRHWFGKGTGRPGEGK